MTTANTKLKAFILGTLYTGLGLSPAMASDIEIYVGEGGDLSAIRPNILFIIDTSGSMDNNVPQSIPDYEPSTTYDENYLNPDDADGDDVKLTTSELCPMTRVYYTEGGQPACSGDDYYDDNKFTCKAARDAFLVAPSFTDTYAEYDEFFDDRWEDLKSNTHNRRVECEDDLGVHGETDAEVNKLWPSSESGHRPWTADDTRELDWGNFDIYTFWSSNYINYLAYFAKNPADPKDRLRVVQEVTRNIFNSVNNVNMGLMHFDVDAAGGMIVHEVENIADARADLLAAVDDLHHDGSTPLSETLYEAGLYFMGRTWDYGDDSRRPNPNASPPFSSNHTFISVANSRKASPDDDEYKSPIEFQCQKNFIVLLTDGVPTSDTGPDSGSRLGSSSKWPGYYGLTGQSSSNRCSGSGSGQCLDDIAEYLFKADLANAAPNNLLGKQNVTTFTVGFATDQTLLESTAEKGGGKYFTANNTSELTEAFTRIVAEILSINTTFTAPAVSVNAFNRTVHLNQLFFTVFKPLETPHWDGNVKRFDLGNVTIAGENSVEIVDQDGNMAVDPNTGFFKDDAISFWTDKTDADQSPDGGEAKKGGAASRIDATINNRKIYTYLGSNVALTDATNKFHEDNTGILQSDLGAANAAERTELLQWARGMDVKDSDEDGSTTDTRHIMGDPLHSKPIVVTYGDLDPDPDILDPDITLFYATNDGYFHAVNGKTGAELFAFVPKAAFPNFKTLIDNEIATDPIGSKNYGLDTPITAWVNDIDRDGIIEPANSEHVYLYIGQRRGGRDYYALDVTNRAAPKFLWQISGGSGSFAELGQSWSQPALAKVKVGANDKMVLVFGGGYDAATQDGANTYANDTVGRAMFMVDATTGAKVWSGGHDNTFDETFADMDSSIPSDVRVLDMNTDGLADRMYVGDMGGRLWRFDINNGSAVADLVDGGAIASLGGAALEGLTPAATADEKKEHNRRFYHAPDVALIIDEVLGNYLNIAIGSGYRAHPLDNRIRDRFFSVRDTNVFNKPGNYAYGIDTDDSNNGTNSDLTDVTLNLIAEGTDAEKTAAVTALAEDDGWFIDLVKLSDNSLEGEKVLAESVTFQNQILFTTFTPINELDPNATNCAPSQGLARTYLVSAATAEPVENLDNSDPGPLTRSDRALNLTRGGIPPSVTVLFPEITQGQPIALVGPEKIPLSLTNPPVRTYWYQEDTGEQ